MKYILIIIALIAIITCNTENITKLDNIVYKASNKDLASPNKFGYKLITSLKENLKSLSEFQAKRNEILENEKLVETLHLRDTSNEPPLFLSIHIYKNEKAALTAFRDYINFEACCISDEDIVKLKNFESLKSFKNSSSNCIYANNIVITFFSGKNIDDSKAIKNLLADQLKNISYLDLQIGHGGPAVWTINKFTID